MQTGKPGQLVIVTRPYNVVTWPNQVEAGTIGRLVAYQRTEQLCEVWSMEVEGRLLGVWLGNCEPYEPPCVSASKEIGEAMRRIPEEKLKEVQAKLEAKARKRRIGQPKVSVFIQEVYHYDRWLDEVMVYVNGEPLRTRGVIGGEPEDNLRYRDYKWIEQMLCELAAALGAQVVLDELPALPAATPDPPPRFNEGDPVEHVVGKAKGTIKSAGSDESLVLWTDGGLMMHKNEFLRKDPTR